MSGLCQRKRRLNAKLAKNFDTSAKRCKDNSEGAQKSSTPGEIYKINSSIASMNGASVGSKLRSGQRSTGARSSTP